MESESPLSPAIRTWLDNVLIPALVRQYLDEQRAIADNGEGQLPSSGAATSDEEPVQ